MRRRALYARPSSQWDGVLYSGFGNGAGQLPVPPGFADLEDVTVEFISCYSAMDPDGAGADTSLLTKLVAAMGGAANGNTGTGYVGTANSQIYSKLDGGNNDQQKLARASLNQMEGLWTTNPPANRPGTGGQGQPDNHQTAGQAMVDATVGDNVIVFSIPNEVGGIGVAGYGPPTDNVTFGGGPSDCGTGDVEYLLDAVAVPSLGFGATLGLAAVAMAVGIALLRRAR